MTPSTSHWSILVAGDVDSPVRKLLFEQLSLAESLHTSSLLTFYLPCFLVHAKLCKQFTPPCLKTETGMRVGNIRVLCAVWGRLLFCEVSYASTILANYKASKMVERRGGGVCSWQKLISKLYYVLSQRFLAIYCTILLHILIRHTLLNRFIHTSKSHSTTIMFKFFNIICPPVKCFQKVSPNELCSVGKKD